MNNILDTHISAMKLDTEENQDKSLRSVLKWMHTPLNQLDPSRQELLTYSTIPTKEDPSNILEGRMLINEYQFCSDEDMSLFGKSTARHEEIKIVNSPRSPSTKMQVNIDLLQDKIKKLEMKLTK